MGIQDRLNLTRRKVGIGLGVVALLVVAVFVWQAYTASRALVEARRHADEVQKLIQGGDFDGATRALEDLRSDASRAHARTGGVLWDIGRHIPYFGRNVGAVQTVAEVLDTGTRINAPIALQLSQALNAGAFKPVNGQIDLAKVHELTPSVQKAASSIDDAGRKLDDIRPSDLTFPFNDLVGDLQDQVDAARSAANATATAFDLLPQMLGEKGTRNYLLMIQNPAELRSTGGLPGSVAILTAKGGRLAMGWQGSAGDLNPFSGPVLKLPKDTLLQYGTTPATDFRDLNFTPDFPEASQIARAMVKQKLNIDVDGVVSIDPIALGYLMQGTGPVAVTGGITLNAGNVAATLLNQTYRVVQDPIGQDDFFEDVARKVFDAVMTGQGNQQQAIKGLATGTSEHRILLWSAEKSEEDRLIGTAVGGSLEQAHRDSPAVGIYFNDSVAGKVDYYLQYRSSVTAVDCRKGGAQDLRASIVLKSTVPSNFSGLGPYILGNGDYAKEGLIAANMRIYAPPGGEVVEMKVDGVTASVTADEHFGRQVAFLPVQLKPGQEITVTADIRTAEGQDADGVYSFTPGMVPAPNGTQIASACS